MEGICHFWVFSAAVRAALPRLASHRKPMRSISRSVTTTTITTSKSRAGFPQRSRCPFAKLNWRANDPQRATLQAVNLFPTSRQGILREVRMYCFRLGNCGTFMPLQDFWRVSRMAFVWTWFVAAISATSSLYFSVRSTHGVVLSTGDCG